MKYILKPHMAKTYAQERYGIECPKGYSKKPKPKNDPKISNGASAVCSVVIIGSRSSASIVRCLYWRMKYVHIN